MPHPVDLGERAVETALMRLQRAVGQLEAAADTVALRSAAESEGQRSEAADEGADKDRQTAEIEAVLVRLDDTVARLRAVVEDESMPDREAHA